MTMILNYPMKTHPLVGKFEKQLRSRWGSFHVNLIMLQSALLISSPNQQYHLAFLQYFQ